MFYSDEERNIFEYFNGKTIVGVDPYDIQLKIAAMEDFDWELAFGVFMKDHESATPADNREAAQISIEMISKLRAVFDIAPLEKTPEGYVGLGGSGVLKVLTDWFEFISDLKKKDESTPTSPPNMEQGVSEVSLTTSSLLSI
jgi:hypothetical protein